MKSLPIRFIAIFYSLLYSESTSAQQCTGNACQNLLVTTKADGCIRLRNDTTVGIKVNKIKEYFADTNYIVPAKSYFDPTVQLRKFCAKSWVYDYTAEFVSAPPNSASSSKISQKVPSEYSFFIDTIIPVNLRDPAYHAYFPTQRLYIAIYDLDETWRVKGPWLSNAKDKLTPLLDGNLKLRGRSGSAYVLMETPDLGKCTTMSGKVVACEKDTGSDNDPGDRTFLVEGKARRFKHVAADGATFFIHPEIRWNPISILQNPPKIPF